MLFRFLTVKRNSEETLVECVSFLAKSKFLIFFDMHWFIFFNFFCERNYDMVKHSQYK